MQIAEYAGGRQRIVKHVGSAHTDAELGVLLGRARELLEHLAQGLLDLYVEPVQPVARLVRAEGLLGCSELGRRSASYSTMRRTLAHTQQVSGQTRVQNQQPMIEDHLSRPLRAADHI